MLPSELMVIVFTNLELKDIGSVRLVCTGWQSLINTSVHLWKCLIRKYCDKKNYLREILNLSIYKNILNSPTKLEKFYRKLHLIQDNLLGNNYRVRTIDCLEAEIDGKKIQKKSENRNNKGVYDMVLDNNVLVASVYDNIQIWDMSKYQISNILPSSILDEPHEKTTCFDLVDAKYLLCGSQNGFLKLFTLNGEFLTKAKHNSNYITDVACQNGNLASLDWYGNITLWSIKFSTFHGKVSVSLECVSSEDTFTVPRILAERECERLLYTSSKYLVTTFRTHLTCYNKTEFFRSYPAPTEVFCLCIQDDKLAFGCKGDANSTSAGILNLDPDKFPSVIYLKTRDNDPIISMSFHDNILVMGDTNGELHIVKVDKLQFPDTTNEVTVELGQENDYGVQFVSTIRTHEYSFFVWAVKTDSYRIFSGDETGKIIVHDYLMFED